MRSCANSLAFARNRLAHAVKFGTAAAPHDLDGVCVREQLLQLFEQVIVLTAYDNEPVSVVCRARSASSSLQARRG